MHIVWRHTVAASYPRSDDQPTRAVEATMQHYPLQRSTVYRASRNMQRVVGLDAE